MLICEAILKTDQTVKIKRLFYMYNRINQSINNTIFIAGTS